MDSLIHPFGPICDAHSRILILGSFPSVKSRQQGFYYGHPQNRFWRVLAALTGEAVPETAEQKRKLLLSHHIALWDVCASCRVEGSADASIRDALPNDIGGILKQAPVKVILANGKTAGKLFEKLVLPALSFSGVYRVMPSTSPANASVKLDALIEAWRAGMCADM